MGTGLVHRWGAMDTEITDRHRRADARRNRERVLVAASEMLAESGLKAPMEEIARRAGVGVGTVCRNFPTKKHMVDAVLADLYETLLQDALDGLANPDAGEAFETFVVVLSAFQARHRALAEQMANDMETPTAPPEARERLWAAISQLVARAQEVGTVRGDIGPADVALLLSGVAHATAVAGDLQHGLRDRYLRIVLDGLRPDAASPLPGEPLDFPQLQELKQRATTGPPSR
jgi:AcrR family transcriptional regulator